ncbi:MAG TPA: single-stranded-DNA-specific exonuclease RecJ [Burkholderiales bacterium]|nr:single-stranded-DNA-specific exonuclease RecJ [Burkholderiales bacterium]HYA47697.1 single-stranded-DNA-specific exonuclease RecJ [Burkholderiales bacterium]
MNGTRIVTRPVSPRTHDQLVREGLHPVLARVCAARGIRHRGELEDKLAGLVPPAELMNAERAGALLADAIAAGKRMLIVADYDCDGATACAVGVRALSAFGATVGYLVPNRFEHGYGLTPEIVAIAARSKPDLLITVDNGIASVEGVDAARQARIDVLITDHHLPGARLPAAAVIVNPNQPGCAFPSKSLAGVGVMFYVMLALRAELRRRGAFAGKEEPVLGDLLDLVALGTVADVVPLDFNNRVLVTQGLRRIRAGRMQEGVRALFAVAGRQPMRAGSFDLGFLLGPRLNAAGRLSDMSLGIECLTTDDRGRALEIARRLDDLNQERRTIESEMQAQAEELVAKISVGESCSISLYDPSWHQGVIGILAGRIKDRAHRPAFAFAPSGPGEIRGSGRSIAGLHLRDALDLLAKREPGLLLRFGGHAAAAGLTLRASDFERFARGFEDVARELLSPAQLSRSIETDGSLEPAYLDLGLARLLDHQVWGQGFPQPLFCDDFEVQGQRVVGDKHLKLKLARAGRTLEAMRFNALDPLPAQVRAAYRLSVEEFRGAQNLQLVIEHWETA